MIRASIYILSTLPLNNLFCNETLPVPFLVSIHCILYYLSIWICLFVSPCCIYLHYLDFVSIILCLLQEISSTENHLDKSQTSSFPMNVFKLVKTVLTYKNKSFEYRTSGKVFRNKAEEKDHSHLYYLELVWLVLSISSPTLKMWATLSLRQGSSSSLPIPVISSLLCLLWHPNDPQVSYQIDKEKENL